MTDGGEGGLAYIPGTPSLTTAISAGIVTCDHLGVIYRQRNTNVYTKWIFIRVDHRVNEYLTVIKR